MFQIFTYSFIQGPDMNETHGLCVKSIANASPAQSPAFINGTKESWSSTEYSTWTESRWSGYSARIFLKPSQEQQVRYLYCIPFKLPIVMSHHSNMFVYAFMSPVFSWIHYLCDQLNTEDKDLETNCSCVMSLQKFG